MQAMMWLKSKYNFLLMLLLPLLCAAQDSLINNAQPKKYEFNLQQTVDYALQNNVTVKNALLEIKVQKEQVKQIIAAAYPHINASLGTTYNPAIATQVIPNFISPATYQVLIDKGVRDGNGNPIQMPNDFGFIAAQFGTKFNANAGIALHQILFDGQVFVGLLAKGSVIKLAEKTAEVTTETIKANIHKVYYQLVVSKEQVEMLDALISLTEKNLSLIHI
jgi:outer membrane protein